MRMEFTKEELKYDFERGDYALVVMRDDTLIDIKKIEGGFLDVSNEDDNRAFVSLLYTNGKRNERSMYKVQFLSPLAFSRDFEMRV